MRKGFWQQKKEAELWQAESLILERIQKKKQKEEEQEEEPVEDDWGLEGEPVEDDWGLEEP